MSYFKQKIQIIDENSNYQVIQQQNELYARRYKRFLLAQQPHYNLHSMIRGRNGTPTNMVLSGRKFVGFGAMPRFIRQRYRLRNILFRTQSYRSLFTTLPTIYEEDHTETSQNSTSFQTNSPKSPNKIKRFKPSSYYSNYADDKIEIDYNHYLYSDSYSEENNKKKFELTPTASDNNQRQTSMATIPPVTLASTRKNQNNQPNNAYKKKLEMKDLDIEFEKLKRGTSRSSSVDNFARPASSGKLNSKNYFYTHILIEGFCFFYR